MIKKVIFRADTLISLLILTYAYFFQKLNQKRGVLYENE